MTLLHIDSAITGDASVTRKLSAAVVDRLRKISPGVEVVYRDLARDPLPMFSAGTLAGIAVTPQPQPPEHQAEARLEDVVLGEFMAADTVVIGAPMYNFGVPAQLKTWIDYLSKEGVTFARGPQGAVGLVRGKRIVIASARGGFYGPGSPAAASEHQESYLQAVWRFFGLTDVSVIRAEGVAAGPDRARAAMDKAFAEVDLLEAPAAAA